MQLAKRYLYLCVASLVVVTIAGQKARSADWPMWRHDAQRSGASPDETLPGELHPQWSRDCGPVQPAWADARLRFDASHEPVVLGRTMFVGSAATESVTAIDTRTGDRKWQFFAEGPVRFAPVAFEGRIYFGSDDGCLYCVDAESGELVWKYNAAPRARKVIGNDHLISVWPVRGGPVMADGKLYFTAGVWPFEGVFLHAIDVDGTETEPVASVSKLPGEVVAQGYAVASPSGVLIPCGRKPALQFDRSSETFGRPGSGTGYHVTASGPWVFHGGGVYNSVNRQKISLRAHRPVTRGDRVFTVLSNNAVACFDVEQFEWIEVKDRQGKPTKKQVFPVQWQVDGRAILAAAAECDGTIPEKSRPTVSIQAGNRLYGHWGNVLFAVDIPAAKSSVAAVSWSTTVPGEPASMLAADGRLFVATGDGLIHCFGPEKKEPAVHTLAQAKLQSTPSADKVARLLDCTKAKQGYGLVLGIGTGQILDELVRQSDLRLVAIDPDAKKIARIRRRFSDAGQYGSRVVARTGDPVTFSLPPYMANLIVSGDLEAAGVERGEPLVEAVYEALRPYGGVACAELTDGAHEDLGELAKQLSKARVQREGPFTLLTRAGALEGAADWTDEYADPANTMMSKDQRVKAPLGVLWFGGPAARPDLFYDRHQWSPSLAVIEGRMFIEGPRKLTAVDIYTGRILWQVPLKDGLSPGRRANWASTGFHFVAATDGIYLTYEKVCLVYDPATGEKIDELRLPEEEDRFGRIRISNDLLIVPVFGTVEKYGDVPVKIVAMDRHDGRIVWTKKSELSFPFLAVSDSRVFAFEGLMARLYENRERKGLVPSAEPFCNLKALDAATGEELWDRTTDQVVTWLAYSRETDVLVTSNKHGVKGWRGKDGAELWSKIAEGRGFRGHPENLWDKVILWKDRVIDQRGPGHAYDLQSGDRVMCEHPVTGESVPWEFTKNGHHCGYVIASEHLLTFRAATAGYTDMATGGTTHLHGFRSGCRNSLIPAGGVLSAPNFANGCTCDFQVFTSLALVHVPQADQWAYSAFGRPGARVRRVGINFGAPGSRQVADGSLWLNYPGKSGPAGDLQVTVEGEQPKWFCGHASQIQGNDLTWVAASGVEGISSVTVPLGAATSENRHYTLRMVFAEPNNHQVGQRVFDVCLGEKKLLADFDVVKESAGHNRMVVKEFQGVRGADTLQLSFEASVGEPVLCGLELVEE